MFPAKPGILDEPRELAAEDVVFVFNTQYQDPRVISAIRNMIDKVTALDRYTVEVKVNYFHVDWQYWLHLCLAVVKELRG